MRTVLDFCSTYMGNSVHHHTPSLVSLVSTSPDSTEIYYSQGIFIGEKNRSFTPTAIMDSQQQVDISKLSDADKKELNQFLTSAAQKSQIQQSELAPLLSLLSYSN